MFTDAQDAPTTCVGADRRPIPVGEPDEITEDEKSIFFRVVVGTAAPVAQHRIEAAHTRGHLSGMPRDVPVC